MLAVCVGLLGFAIVSLSVGSGGEKGEVKITGAEEMQSLVGGIPQDGARLGLVGRPGDRPGVQRPVVRSVLRLEPGRDRAADPGPGSKRRRPARLPQLPDEPNPGSSSGPTAAVAAAKQDYEWQFIQLFFANQDEAKKPGADQDFLDAIARGVGVVNFNVEQWQRDMKDDDIQETLEADEKLGRDAGSRPSPPSWSAGRTGPSS